MDLESFTAKVFKALLITLAFVLLIYAIEFFLLVFGGILLAVFLRSVSVFISQKLNLKISLSLAIITLLLLSLISGTLILIGPSIDKQLENANQSFPASLKHFEENMIRTKFGKKLFEGAEEGIRNISSNKSALLSKIKGIFSTSLTLLLDCLIILITGIFFASNPSLYTDNIVRLFPVSFRVKTIRVFNDCYETLKHWLMGKFLSMLLVGLATGIGLSLLGIPMVIVLSLMAMFLTFIPHIGPVIAAFPAVLIAFMQSQEKALFVVILYIGIQLIENYILIPLIMKRTVKLPPAFALFSQVLLGILAGGIGVVFATPLFAASKVIVKELYVKELEKDRMKIS